MDCNCNNQLRDSAGAESLKALYARKGAGSVSFGEKITNNLPVLGVGIGAGVVGAILINKVKKRR